MVNGRDGAVAQAWEQCCRQHQTYSPRSEPLPQSLDAVTAEWLTRTLQVRYPELVVEDLRIVDVINTHTTKVRVALEVNRWGREAGFPTTACLKANWSGNPLSSGAGICALEARFYRYMRDELPVPAPAGYFADWDDDSFNQGLIVMEDLVQSNVVFGSACRPIDVEETARSLDELSALHAGWWNSPQLDKHAWLGDSMGAETSDPHLYRSLEHCMVENIKQPDRRAVLPAWFLQEPERLSRAYDKLVVHERQQQGPRCLLHGDAHLGNIYVTAEGRRRWLDWQIVRKGSPWRDVNYFLISALPVAQRRSNERELLRHYLECLKARGATPPSFDDAWREYCLWPIHGLASFNGSKDEWQEPNAIRDGVERFSAAIDDLESLRLIDLS